MAPETTELPQTTNGDEAVEAVAAAAKAKNGEAAAEVAQIVIDRIDAETIRVPIIGTAPLIMHRFDEKAKRKMLDEMQGRKSPREPKNPEAEYNAAFYRLDDETPCFPVLAFKDATVGGARFYGKSVTMTALRQFVFFRGEMGPDGRQYARIEGEPKMREDVVRLGRSGTDLRYRPEFMPWKTTLIVTYVKAALTRGSVLSLIDAGGMGIGVGEWRPEKQGDFGTYMIDQTREVEVLTDKGELEPAQ